MVRFKTKNEKGNRFPVSHEKPVRKCNGKNNTKPKTILYFILLTNKLQEVIFTFKSLPTLMKNIYVNGEEINISEKNPKFIDFSINISTEFLENLTV